MPATTTTLSEVLARLARPYEPIAVCEVLLGVPHRAARHFVSTVLATSEEAEALLDAMPRTIRSLAIATTDTPLRCHGEIRGAVMWSETISSRAASAGDSGLFVCASPSRAFDTHENRVLVAALATVVAAADGAQQSASGNEAREDLVRRARNNGQRALRYLDHRSLTDLPRRRPRGRAVQRTAAGSRRSTYQPALEMLNRAAAPLRAEQLEELLSPQRAERLALLVAALDAAERHAIARHPSAGDRARVRGVVRPTLRTRHGGLEAGPVRYEPAADGQVLVAGQAVNDADEVEAVVRSAPGWTPT